MDEDRAWGQATVGKEKDMSSSSQRRKPARHTIVRVLSGWRRAPRALSEQRERLVTQQELSELRFAR